MANFANLPKSVLLKPPGGISAEVKEILARPGTLSLFDEKVYGLSVPLGNETWKGKQARLVGVWGGDGSGNRLEVVSRDSAKLSVTLVSEQPVGKHLWAWIVEAKTAATQCPATYLEARVGEPSGQEYCKALPVDILDEAARSARLSSFGGGNADQTRQAIINECHRQGVKLNTQVAYIIATVEHETGIFAPVREGFFRKHPEAFRRSLHYYPYYGRGFVQLTWKKNYHKYSNMVNGDLVADPDLALQPAVALFVLVHGMMNGSFGSRLPNFVNEHKTDFVGARHSVNGQDRAAHIANLAQKWLTKLAKMAG